jgi:hypothetical protein
MRGDRVSEGGAFKVEVDCQGSEIIGELDRAACCGDLEAVE